MSAQIATVEDFRELKGLVLGLTGKITSLESEIKAMRDDSIPERLTVVEAAKMMRVTPTTIHRYIDAGRLDSQKVGERKTLVSHASVVAFLVKHSS